MHYFIILFITFFTFNSFALNASLSKNKVIIDVNFKGDAITIFGIKEAEGKLAVVLKSPKTSYKVYGKEKIFGMWQNTNPKIFKDIYNTYIINLESNFNAIEGTVLKNFELGLQNINFENFTIANELLNSAGYQDAFVKQQKILNKFAENQNKITILEDANRFITQVNIPVDAKPGNYLLEVMLMNESAIIEAITFKITLEEEGLVKAIKDLAKQQKPLYALLAILISISISLIVFTIFNFLKAIFVKKTTKTNA